MPTHRPGLLQAGLGAVLLFSAMLVPTAGASADVAGMDAAYRGPVADAFTAAAAADTTSDGAGKDAARDPSADRRTGELAALSGVSAGDVPAGGASADDPSPRDEWAVHPPGWTGLARDGLGRIDPGQDVVARDEDSSLAVIQALHSQDVEVSRRIGGMQDLMTTEQLLASLGDRLDTEALDRVEVAERSEEWRCLAEAMYFEARGEGLLGQIAVAEVILNRVESTRYPDTICDVVRQGAANGGACQFSYNCDGLKNRIGNKPVWERIGKVAWLMLQGRPRTLTDEALYFHNTSVSPSWSRVYIRTAKIGRHIFYRPKVRLSMR